MTKVAVVILNWNGENLLREFLPLVIQNSLVDGVEIVVADNASTDKSIDILKNEFPTVKIVQLDKNYGFTGGYNRALKQIEAQYFVLLNSDVAPQKDWLPPLISEMDNNADVAVCVPKIKSYKQPSYFEYAGAAGGFIDKYGFPFCRGRIFDCVEEDNGQYNTSSEIFWASGAAMIIRSELYAKAGGLDEDFFAHMEEIDLCWRMKNMGHKITYVAQSEVLHLGGATLSYQNPQKVYLNFRNNLFLLTKNLPQNILCLTIFKRMIFDGIAGIKFLLSGEIRNFLSVIKAHLSFYRCYKIMYKKRSKQNTPISHHKGMYNGSIVFDYFIKKKTKYSDINFN